MATESVVAAQIVRLLSQKPATVWELMGFTWIS
jgi:hypothetical protein